MGQILPALGIIVGLFLLTGIAWIIAARLGLLKPEVSERVTDDDRAPELPYRIKDSVLSPGERAFLPVLRDAVQLVATARQLPLPVVFASVRFAEVFQVDANRSDDPSAWQTAQNKITSKQADFVICDPKTTRPLLVVELDDQSHARADRKNRDGFVDRACASAGLPILHVRAAGSYDTKKLAADIAALIRARP